ncbi:MAG: LacI family DNA-binding transcriptional regulator, partial [Devosia sp.]
MTDVAQLAGVSQSTVSVV